MSMIDLRKKAGIVLAKRKIHTVRARVGFAIDVSGSMKELYVRGVVQAVSERFLALAMNLDDDGSMDAWAFDERMATLPTITGSSIGGYVRREIMDSPISKWGGTAYAPPIAAARANWFEAERVGGFLGFGGRKVEKPQTPALLLFLTDGENTDQRETETAIEATSSRPLYIQFIGIGGGSFPFIERMGDRYPNVGFMSVPDIASIPDDALYEGLVTDELATWLRAASA
ncbi:VWA domain-containing protein [Muricoccus radiodurans]|uniref:VWA domain-containing protein n=1 Tax=Muricoccus radiodurans TaxID=2231721 RepID=UPI003CFA35A0